MDKRRVRKMLDAYLDIEEPICRWCFAIDKQMVKGELIGEHDFPDAYLQHLRCPKCGGEFTAYYGYANVDYVMDRVKQLHPKRRVSPKQFGEIMQLVMLEDFGKGERGLLCDFWLLLSVAK